jgi:HSP20 family protein
MTTTTPVKETKKESTGITPRKSHPFHALQEEMNHLFDEFKSGLPFARTFWLEPVSDFNAKVDMKDSEKTIEVSAELPGVEMKDIEVKVEGNALSIKGEKHSEKEEKEKNYYRMERSYGSFYRLLPLPCTVEKDSIEASYKDGVLKVVMPKAKDALADGKKIEVKAG